MQLDFVSLLPLYVEIYSKPRDMQRFREGYLANLTTPDGQDVAIVPLGPMNPMAREPVLEAIKALIALGADAMGRDETAALQPAVARAAAGAKPLQIGDRRQVAVPQSLKVGFSVLDATGGWTNRVTNDFTMRAAVSANAERGWCCITLWAQNAYSPETLRQTIRRDVLRLAHVLQHGHPRTLRQWLAQEGAASAGAGERNVTEREELAYTSEVLAPLLDKSDMPTLVAALYGDDAARACGYPPLDLSANAGFDLALAQRLSS